MAGTLKVSYMISWGWRRHVGVHKPTLSRPAHLKNKRSHRLPQQPQDQSIHCNSGRTPPTCPTTSNPKVLHIQRYEKRKFDDATAIGSVVLQEVETGNARESRTTGARVNLVKDETTLLSEWGLRLTHAVAILAQD